MNQPTTEARTPRSLVRHAPAPPMNSDNGRFKSQIPVRARYGQPQLSRPSTRPFPPTQRHDVLPASLSTRQSFDKAFNVYRERSRLDTRDLQTMLMDLLIREQQQKEKWHLLCMRVMTERDILRRRVESNESRGVKRAREDPEEPPRSSTSSGSRISPAHSPLGSPSAFPVHSPSTSPPPLSGTSSGSTPPNSSSSNTANFFSTEDSPAVKRRRSSDHLDISSTRRPGNDNIAAFDGLHGRSVGSRSNGEPRPHARHTFFGTEFSHVDIMYVPMDGKLVCRACLLESTKLRQDAAARSPFEPKSFPTTAMWDELRDHCVKEHPTECEDVCRLHPAELFQLRKRLNLLT